MPKDFYEIPGGLKWVKDNLKIIIGNTDLFEIMKFGDLWRERGHVPMVHVISPTHKPGYWDEHEDPSGLLDNLPAHIDMFIVDFNNLNEPELPSKWKGQAPYPYWQLWEFKSGRVCFNGPTRAKFIEKFGIDPEEGIPSGNTGGSTSGGSGTSGGTTGGTTTIPAKIEVTIHVYHHNDEAAQ